MLNSVRIRVSLAQTPALKVKEKGPLLSHRLTRPRLYYISTNTALVVDSCGSDRCTSAARDRSPARQLAAMSGWPPLAAPPTGAGSEELCSTVPADIAADFVRNIASLLVVCFASWKVAAFAQMLHLPRGSGFLLTGMLAGSLLDTMQGLDSAQGRTMIKGISCKYVIFSGSKFYMFFPVRRPPPTPTSRVRGGSAVAQSRADARAARRSTTFARPSSRMPRARSSSTVVTRSY